MRSYSKTGSGDERVETLIGHVASFQALKINVAKKEINQVSRLKLLFHPFLLCYFFEGSKV